MFLKHPIKTILLLVFLTGIVVFLAGRIRWPIQLAQGWTPPVKVTVSQDGMDGSGDLYKWHDTMILLQQRYDRSAKSSTCSIMVRNGDSTNFWIQLPLPDIPNGYNFYAPVFDQANDRIVFEQGYTENDQLMMSVILVRLTVPREVQVEAERKWLTDKQLLFGETPPNVHINDPGKRGWPGLGVGAASARDLYFPFCVTAKRYEGKTIYSDEGPFKTGVFHSADSGMTWQMERISESRTGTPTVCSTRGYTYCLGQLDPQNLWFARKPVEAGSWTEADTIIKGTAHVDGCGITAVEDDTIHVCWLDNRHTKWRFSLEGPNYTDDEIAYCHRKDRDAVWAKDIILSKGILDSYAPSISVEGEKIVVAWSGNQTSFAFPYEENPNDIYYATSKDGGKTWAKPLRLTDVAKSGLTAGRPQVVVQNGLIHLLYVQGKEDPHLQLGNQGAWPVYYQQRPFPD